MMYKQPRVHHGKCDAHNSLEFLDTNRSPNPGQKTKPSAEYGKKRTCPLRDFVVPSDQRILNQRKSEKYLDLARELITLRNIRETVLPNIIGIFGTGPKDLEKGRRN